MLGTHVEAEDQLRLAAQFDEHRHQSIDHFVKRREPVKVGWDILCHATMVWEEATSLPSWTAMGNRRRQELHA